MIRIRDQIRDQIRVSHDDMIRIRDQIREGGMSGIRDQDQIRVSHDDMIRIRDQMREGVMIRDQIRVSPICHLRKIRSILHFLVKNYINGKIFIFLILT